MSPKEKIGKEQSERSGENDSLNIIANLLATKDMKEGDKIGALSAAGFKNQDIARLLEKDPNAVRQAIFQKRKRGNKPKSRKT